MTLQYNDTSHVHAVTNAGSNTYSYDANGDQFGARANSNGDVEVYKNGSLLAVRSITAWSYYTSGGYIG
jgi:hypothetical protein